jgi:hypothetical protein
MSCLSVSYHIIIIIITIAIIKAGPEPRTATPRPDSVGPPAGWPTGWLATRPLGPKPNHQNARSGNELPPGNSSAIQPRIDCNRISQAAAALRRPTRPAGSAHRHVDPRMHALPFSSSTLSFTLPALLCSPSPARLSFCHAFSIVFSLRYPNLALFPWCTHPHTKETFSGAV